MSVLSRYYHSKTPFCSWDLVWQPHSRCHGYRDSRVTIEHCLCMALQICCLVTMEEKWQPILANTTPLDGITVLLRHSWDWAWRQRLVCLVSMLHTFPWRGVWVFWGPAPWRESSSSHICTYLYITTFWKGFMLPSSGVRDMVTRIFVTPHSIWESLQLRSYLTIWRRKEDPIPQFSGFCLGKQDAKQSPRARN